MYHPNKKQISVWELVGPEAHARWGDSAIMLMNPLLCISLQQIRNRHGRLRLNSTKLGFTQRGFRTDKHWKLNKDLEGAKAELDRLQRFAKSRSAHLRGDAQDFDPLDSTVEAVYDDIRNNPDLYPFIHFVETGVSWGHIDVRNQPDITFWDKNTGEVEIVKQKPIEWGLIVPGFK